MQLPNIVKISGLPSFYRSKVLEPLKDINHASGGADHDGAWGDMESSGFRGWQ